MQQANDCTYELDLKALMVGLVATGADHFLFLLLEKFGVLRWLYGASAVSGVQNDVWFKNEKYHERMMEECLKLMIVMANEAPKQQDNVGKEARSKSGGSGADGADGEGDEFSNNSEFAALLKNNVIHKLIAKPCPPSVLMKLGATLAGGQDDFEHANTTQTVRHQLREVATLKKADDDYSSVSSDGGSSKFELKDEYFNCYDPYYIRLSNDEHFEAKERWISRRNNTTKKGIFRSSSPIVPPTLPFYDDVTTMFVTPQFISLMQALLMKGSLNGHKNANKNANKNALLNTNLTSTMYHSLSITCHVLLTKPKNVQVICLKSMCLTNPTHPPLVFPSTIQNVCLNLRTTMYGVLGN